MLYEVPTMTYVMTRRQQTGRRMTNLLLLFLPLNRIKVWEPQADPSENHFYTQNIGLIIFTDRYVLHLHTVMPILIYFDYV